MTSSLVFLCLESYNGRNPGVKAFNLQYSTFHNIRAVFVCNRSRIDFYNYWGQIFSSTDTTYLFLFPVIYQPFPLFPHQWCHFHIFKTLQLYPLSAWFHLYYTTYKGLNICNFFSPDSSENFTFPFSFIFSSYLSWVLIQTIKPNTGTKDNWKDGPGKLSFVQSLYH